MKMASSTGNLLNSHTLWQSRTCDERKYAVKKKKVDGQVSKFLHCSLQKI